MGKKKNKGKKKDAPKVESIDLAKATKKAAKLPKVLEGDEAIAEVKARVNAKRAAREAEAGSKEVTPEGMLGAADRIIEDKNSTADEVKAAKKARKKAKALIAERAEGFKLAAAERERGLAAVAEVTGAQDEKLSQHDVEHGLLSEKERKAFHKKSKPGESPSEWLARSGKEDEAEVVAAFAEGVVEADRPDPVADEVDKKIKKAKKAEAAQAEKDAAPQVAEEVDTEKGREFVVGTPDADGEVVGATQLVDRDYLDRPKIPQFNDDGSPVLDSKKKPKSLPYTRTTTYIKCLEDTTLLEKWKMRVLLAGAGLDLEQYDTTEGLDLADSLVGQARKVVKAYDKALTKITKREAKGELDLGQLGLLRAEAKKAHNDALNALAETALDLGDVHERATKGTNLHALTQAYDAGEVKLGDKAQREALIAEGRWTASDFADLIAYAEKMSELGIKHIMVEAFVVDDVKKVAGTLDRGSLYKFPGTARAIRCVADIKTGNVTFSAGTIGMQLKQYAESKGYDPNQPKQRVDLKLSKTKGLLIHLPQGEARCDVYEVDLDLAGKGLALAGQVRAWRNEGKAVFDLGKPLAAS